VRKANIPVGPGDRIRVQTSGGGGYSDPLKREPSEVAADVRFGYVSREAAEGMYGVVLDPQGAVLAHETAERRARLAAQR
jgi:N-methylhydantoinase B